MTVAIEQHNPLLVRMLIEHGYHMSRKFKWGQTPLEMCLRLAQKCVVILNVSRPKTYCHSMRFFLFLFIFRVNFQLTLVSLRPCIYSVDIRQRHVL